MDMIDLILNCRKGDLPAVQYLVEQKEVELNVRDKWDSTPLYYACLCGHEDVVRYLLQNGAKCEANTFDGERCLYGSLNNEIRHVLKNFKAITSSLIRRDCYSEFLRRLLEKGSEADVLFVVHGERMAAHRCVLSARSEYFADMFRNRWKNRLVITLKHRLVKPFAFKAILCYLYSARLEANIDQLEDILRIARQCALQNLIVDLEEKIKRVLSFESTKPGVNVTVITIEPSLDSSELQLDLGMLAAQALPLEFCTEAEIELPFRPESVQTFADLIFSVDGHHFKCHKAFFCGRSDYFKALLEDHFGESHTDDVNHLPVVPLHEVGATVFVQIMYYIYQDSCELNSENVYDILCAGDLYMLPGLKRHCANVIAQYLEADNVINILRTARLFNLPRLEDQCAKFIAGNIDKMIQRSDFAACVMDDAGGVKERQETDTIPIIDDIRFHITNFIQTFSDTYEADRKLILIDGFLEELGLDA